MNLEHTLESPEVLLNTGCLAAPQTRGVKTSGDGASHTLFKTPWALLVSGVSGIVARGGDDILS